MLNKIINYGYDTNVFFAYMLPVEGKGFFCETKLITNQLNQRNQQMYYVWRSNITCNKTHEGVEKFV